MTNPTDEWFPSQFCPIPVRCVDATTIQDAPNPQFFFEHDSKRFGIDIYRNLTGMYRFSFRFSPGPAGASSQNVPLDSGGKCLRCGKEIANAAPGETGILVGH